VEDIDWNEGLIHIRRSKTYRERTLPLPSDAGAVLTAYIQHERPRSPHREVFLTASTPHVPLTRATTVTFITRHFLERIGLHGRHLGTHLGHATAMHLLQSGVDIATIALWLGHESIETYPWIRGC
jgi:site-specific recombinase XerD